MIYAVHRRAPQYQLQEPPPHYHDHGAHVILGIGPPYDAAEGEFNVVDWQMDVNVQEEGRGVEIENRKQM